MKINSITTFHICIILLLGTVMSGCAYKESKVQVEELPELEYAFTSIHYYNSQSKESIKHEYNGVVRFSRDSVVVNVQNTTNPNDYESELYMVKAVSGDSDSYSIHVLGGGVFSVYLSDSASISIVVFQAGREMLTYGKAK